MSDPIKILPHAESDLPIPPIAAIIDRAHECRESAIRLADEAAAAQLTRLIDNVPHATLCWQLGTLIVDSPSGNHYEVTAARCSCLNGAKGQHRCWHWALRNVLLDMFDTEVESADSAADDAARMQELFNDRLEATARALRAMRQSQGRMLASRLCSARGAWLSTL